jgi:hypothetical protein
MSRLRANPVSAKALLGALLLTLVAGVAACDEDGKTAPQRCLDPALPIFDIQAGAPDDVQNPCVTEVGHAINQTGSSPTTAGTSTGGSGTGGKGSSTATAGAGAGGAP